MAHYQQLEFVRVVKNALPSYFSGTSVLEVGSWDVSGSVRQHFSNCNYVGADITSGPGIDLVCQGQDIEMPTGTFDVVITCECFEHNPFWVETFVNMTRMLKSGGLFILSCAAPGRIEHGTARRRADASLTASFGAPDYYRNLGESDFRRRFNLDNHFESFGFVPSRYCSDLYFVAVKKGDPSDPGRTAGVRSALDAARQIALPPGSGTRAAWKRLLMATMGRSLEGLLGGERYQNWTYRIHRFLASRQTMGR